MDIGATTGAHTKGDPMIPITLSEATIESLVSWSLSIGAYALVATLLVIVARRVMS